MLSRQAPLRRRHAEPVARTLSVVVLAALLAVPASGCGGDDESGGDGGTSAEPQTTLEVTLDVDGPGGQPAETAAVACPGADACDALASVTASDFEPVPGDQACTELFGGPETAAIEGTLEGEAVQGTFNRSNGCEIERFGAFVPLLRALFPDYEPGGALQQP